MPYSKIRRPQAIREKGFPTVLLILVALVAAFSLTGMANPKVFSLTEALQLSVSQSPGVDSAENAVATAQLGVAKKEASYRVKVTGSSSPLGFSRTEEDAGQWSFGEPVVVSGNLLTPSGFAISATGKVNDRDARTPDLELSLSWKLWPPPEADSTWRSLIDSRSSLQLAQEKFREAQFLAAAATYRQYRNLQVQEANLAILEMDRSAKELIYTQTLHKYQSGAASRVEVLDAVLARDRSRAALDKAVRDFERELSAFLLDFGLDKESLELEKLPTDWVVPIPVPAEESILDEAVAHSTNVLQRFQALDSAKRRLEAAQANNGWAVSVKASAQKRSFNDGPTSYGAYLDVTYDFTDGGLREAELRDAELAYLQAEKAVQDEIQKVRDDVKERISELIWLENQHQIAATAFEKSSLEHEIKKKQYERGLVREFDYQQSVKALEEARLEWIKSAIAYEAARLELLSLTGRSLDIEGGITVEIGAQEIN